MVVLVLLGTILMTFIILIIVVAFLAITVITRIYALLSSGRTGRALGT